jgi:mono/diheme cytochrome c family protein
LTSRTKIAWVIVPALGAAIIFLLGWKGLVAQDADNPRPTPSAAITGDPEVGREAYVSQGCVACHATDGSPRPGPTFMGVWGSTRELSDGTMVVADEDYIRESILDSKAKLVRGYGPVMPDYAGRLNPHELAGIIEFIKSLK